MQSGSQSDDFFLSPNEVWSGDYDDLEKACAEGNGNPALLTSMALVNMFMEKYQGVLNPVYGAWVPLYGIAVNYDITGMQFMYRWANGTYYHKTDVTYQITNAAGCFRIMKIKRFHGGSCTIPVKVVCTAKDFTYP